MCVNPNRRLETTQENGNNSQKVLQSCNLGGGVKAAPLFRVRTATPDEVDQVPPSPAVERGMASAWAQGWVARCNVPGTIYAVINEKDEPVEEYTA